MINAQKYTSKNTSVNSKKVPVAFKYINPFQYRKDNYETVKNADIGGGKYDTGTEYLSQFGVTNLIYDPFNRSEEWNKDILKKMKKCYTSTISSVLCVIKEKSKRLEVIQLAYNSLKRGGYAYFIIYEGDRSGIGKITKKDQWQNNKKTIFYVKEIKSIFWDHVTLFPSKKLIVAKRP